MLNHFFFTTPTPQRFGLKRTRLRVHERQPWPLPLGGPWLPVPRGPAEFGQRPAWRVLLGALRPVAGLLRQARHGAAAAARPAAAAAATARSGSRRVCKGTQGGVGGRVAGLLGDDYGVMNKNIYENGWIWILNKFFSMVLSSLMFWCDWFWNRLM